MSALTTGWYIDANKLMSDVSHGYCHCGAKMDGGAEDGN